MIGERHKLGAEDVSEVPVVLDVHDARQPLACEVCRRRGDLHAYVDSLGDAHFICARCNKTRTK